MGPMIQQMQSSCSSCGGHGKSSRRSPSVRSWRYTYKIVLPTSTRSCAGRASICGYGRFNETGGDRNDVECTRGATCGARLHLRRLARKGGPSRRGVSAETHQHVRDIHRTRNASRTQAQNWRSVTMSPWPSWHTGVSWQNTHGTCSTSFCICVLCSVVLV